MDNPYHGDPTISGSSLVPKLEIIQGDGAGKSFNLKFKTRIGRETDNDIIVTDPKTSRYHCQITFEDGKWMLTDLGSANGTVLNGMPVSVPQSLGHGSQIALGETILVFKDPMDEGELPIDPSTTIIGGPIPPKRRVDSAQTDGMPSRFAWIAGGLILILILAVAGIILWINSNSTPSDNQPSAGLEVITPIRTTPEPDANVLLKFEDDFSDSNSGWDDAFGKYYTKQYGNNQYHIEITTNNLVVWGLANRNAADFEVEVEATHQTVDVGVTYGLIFRYVDHDNYYRFDVSDDGFFLLSKFQEGVWETLIDWTGSSAINTGQVANVLKIIARGPEILLYANGQELTSITDNSFAQGNFGFFASTFETSHIWVSFDNLKLWAPEAQQIAIIPTPTPTTLPFISEAGMLQAESPVVQAEETVAVETPTEASEEISAVTPESPVEAAGTPEAEAFAEGTPEIEVEATATVVPAILPDFVTRDQPLARGQRALPGKIIYPQYDSNRGTYDIYRAATDGSDRELLVADASQVSANLVGDQIAYRSWKSDERGLITRVIGQTDHWRFVSFFEAAAPVFSPDQQFFVFHSRQGGEVPAIYRTFGADHEVLRREGAPIQGEMATFAPDGRLVYKGCTGGNCGLLISNLDGSFPQQLTTYANDTVPSVSPDGSTIAFMSDRDGNWEIYTIDINGENLRRMTNEPGSDGLPAWSPDGKQIAFASNREGTWSIWTMTANGERKHPLFKLDASVDGVAQVDAAHAYGWLEERLAWTP